MMTRGLMAALAAAALLTGPVLAQQNAPTPLLPAGAEANNTEAATLLDRAQKAWDTVQKAPLKALVALAGDAGVVNTYFSCDPSSNNLFGLADGKPFYLNAAWDAMPDDDERRQQLVERHYDMEERIEKGLLALGKKTLAKPDNLQQVWTAAKPVVQGLLKGMNDDALACQRDKWTAYAAAGALAATKVSPKSTPADADTAFLLENVATKADSDNPLQTADDYATAFFERRLADSADSVPLYAQISAELRDMVNATAVERNKPQQ